ncbi:hypothetical protein Tco_0537718 [Tanacetum coccineum]
MTNGQRKPKGQWTPDERKVANLDQRLKSLIMSILLDDQMNSVINCLTAKSTWDDLILYHEGPSDVKESRVMDLKLCYNTFKFKEGETLTQTFTRYKALMNELVNDGIKLSKIEINTSFINGLPKKWLSFCQSLRNINHVKESKLASLFGKLKYEENLIDNSPNDEEDTRSSQEYMDDLEEEYQVRAPLDKSKRLFKKGLKGSVVQKQLTKLNATNVAGRHKPKLRPTKDFEAKYNKVKAKLALLSSSASTSKALMVKNKGLITEAYELDEEEVSLNDNEIVEVNVLMALAEDNEAVSKEGIRNDEWVKIFMRKVHTLFEMEDNDDRKNNLDLSIPGVERPWLSEVEGFILPNHDTGRILLIESQRNTIDPPVAVTDSSTSDYDSTDESSVCSNLLPPLEKLDGAEPVFGPRLL